MPRRLSLLLFFSPGLVCFPHPPAFAGPAADRRFPADKLSLMRFGFLPVYVQYLLTIFSETDVKVSRPHARADAGVLPEKIT